MEKSKEVALTHPAAAVKETPCNSEVKAYQQCLQSPWSSYWTSCKKEQHAFKSCSEFDKWLETTVNLKKTETKQ